MAIFILYGGLIQHWHRAAICEERSPTVGQCHYQQIVSLLRISFILDHTVIVVFFVPAALIKNCITRTIIYNTAIQLLAR